VELSLATGVSIVESVEAGPASFPPAPGRRVKRTAYLTALLALCAAAPAAGDAVRDDLAREILRRVPQWPQTQVEIPIEVYEKFVRDELLGPVPPKPPEAAWVERASWTVRPAEAEAVVEAALDVVALPGLMSRHARVLGADVAWRDVAIGGKPAELRRGDDGWFWLDNPQPGRLRITAKAALKPKTSGDRRTIAWLTAPAGWSSAAFESDAAWEARFSRASAPIIGGGAGTRGTVGLVPPYGPVLGGDRLEVTWQKPQPVVHRAVARIESAADIGWTLAEGVHQVRAVLALRLWGGEVAELTVDLPPGADRVVITGPDVREVQVLEESVRPLRDAPVDSLKEESVRPLRDAPVDSLKGGAARVFLRGPITQRTRLSVAFESPRAKTGRMSLPAFGVRGASQRGGTLAIAGGAGAVLLEMESPGLAPMAIHDLPDAVRGLLAAAPVYAYQLSAGSWEARIDGVDMAEFPVRETLVDSALYTMLYRPDGSIMTKVVYEVRNRGQQYMKVDLPQGARLLVARVAEQQKNLARGPGETVFVPLEKSVLTMAGLISFPVELVYLTKGPPLARQGRLSLPLPRTDLPVAYARCALEVPDGLNVRRWQGTLREVPSWSGETAELEFEYGRGHLAAGLKPPEPKKPPPGARAAGPQDPRKPEKPKSPGILEAIGGLFVASETKYNAVLLRNREEDKQRMAQDAQAAAKEERLSQGALVLQGKNSYRAGVDYYNRREYSKASEHFKKVIEVAPNSTEADNARKYLGNVEIALGREDKGKTEDRSVRAQAKAVQLSQQSANVAVVEKQQELLERAEQSLKAGKEDQAEAAYKVAVGLSGKLRAQGEESKEQDAVVRKAKEFLQQREDQRRRQQQELAQLQSQVQSLKQNIVEKGGQNFSMAIDALVEGREPGQPSPVLTPATVVVRSPAAVHGVEAPRLERPMDPSRQEPAGAQPQTAWTGAAGLTPQPGGRQVQMGEAIAEQQVRVGIAAGYKFISRGADRVPALTAEEVPTAVDNRVEQLRRQVEELKTIHEELGVKGSLPWVRVQGAIDQGADATLRTGGKDTALLLGRKVAEKARQVASQAEQATELARQGRIAEAQDLIQNLEKDQETNVRAAQALAKTGTPQALTKAGAGAMLLDGAKRPAGAIISEGGMRIYIPAAAAAAAAPRFEVASVVAPAAPPAPPPEASTVVSTDAFWTRATESRQAMQVGEKTQTLDRLIAIDPRDQRALWARATELRQAMQFGEAIQTLDRLIAINPEDERARRWREDLAYLEAQSRQVTARERTTAVAGVSAAVPVAPGQPGGTVTYLGYSQTQEGKDLTLFRREFVKGTAAEPAAVAETRRRLGEAIDLDFQKTSLDNVLKYISEVQRGLNIVIDPDIAAAGVDLTTRVVDLKVKRVSIESVLGLILGADLGYGVGPGYVLITTKDKLQQNLPVVTYPVQDDLVAQIPDFSDQAPRFEVATVLQAAAQARGGGGGLFGGGAAVAETGVPASDEWKALTETRRKLEEAKAAVAQKKQDLDRVQFNVRDLTRSSDEEKRLAKFVASNYSWALHSRSAAAGGGSGGAGGGAAPQGGPQPPRTSVPVVARQFTQSPFPDVASNNLVQLAEQGVRVNLNAANAYTGATVVSGGTLTMGGIVVDTNAAARIVQSQGQLSLGGGTLILRNGAYTTFDGSDRVTLQAGDGNLAVANEATIAGNVEVVLERLRTNLGQRVAVGSRNTLLTADAARAAGIAWQQGANGVTYAVINEGQLLSLMDIEQRMPVGHRAAAPQGEVRQEAVVGTPAVLANGGMVSIAQAADDANSLSYNGNTLRVAHDDYLLVDNGRYLTAVKTGRMQHWATEAPPVRFPGVPAAVTVPVVGRTVKFEKTLLDPGDSLELVAEYTWQGEEK